MLRQRVRAVNGRLEWYWEQCGPSRAVSHEDSRPDPSPVAVVKRPPAPADHSPDEPGRLRACI
jgi:hypothetical protein